jgi:hypothetical protein
MDDRVVDRELERTLEDIGERLEYPRRDLWPAVRTRIAARPRLPWWSRFGLSPASLAPVAATLLVMLVALLAVSPDLRARAAEVLGVAGIQIFRVAETPTPGPTTRPIFPGSRVTLAEAKSRAGFPLRVPSDLGEPDDVYLESSASGAQVTLVYTSRSGIPQSPVAGVSAIVVEFAGALDQNVMGKAVGPGTTLERVTVNGGPGFWLAGEPHQFFYRDPSGNLQTGTLRLAANTLLWEEGPITYRLEAQIAKEQALRVAASFR